MHDIDSGCNYSTTTNNSTTNNSTHIVEGASPLPLEHFRLPTGPNSTLPTLTVSGQLNFQMQAKLLNSHLLRHLALQKVLLAKESGVKIQTNEGVPIPLGRFCGSSTPPSITSSTNKVKVVFHGVTSNISLMGFRLSYESVDRQGTLNKVTR